MLRAQNRVLHCTQPASRRLLRKTAVLTHMLGQRNSATANQCPAGICYYTVRYARSALKGSTPTTTTANCGSSFFSWTSQLTFWLFYPPPLTAPSVCSSLCGSSTTHPPTAAPSALDCGVGVFACLGRGSFVFRGIFLFGADLFFWEIKHFKV